MKIIVYLLGVSYVTYCSYLILFTRETLDWLKGLLQKYDLKYLAAFTAAFGLLFLISSCATTHPWIFRLFGLIALCKAVVAFTDPHKIFSKMLDWYFDEAPDQIHHLISIMGIIFGTLMVTWVK